MEFDEKRYVTPGVPKISSAFAERVKINLEKEHETRVDTEYLEQDTENLFHPFTTRKLILTNTYLNYPWKDYQQLENCARRQFMVQAAMIHEALVYAGQRSTRLSDKTGLPILTPQISYDSYMDYIVRTTSGTRSVIEDVALTNKLYISALEDIWKGKNKGIRPDLKITDAKDKVEFLIDSGYLGIGEGLGLLVAQNEIYRLEDQLG